ncbi:MAG: sigma 54-interacting transcriptional regulator [Gemmatimonadota bacterium]
MSDFMTPNEEWVEPEPRHPDPLIGTSSKLLAAKELARTIARTEIPVLILGDTGTGKELLAQYIHDRSGRRGHLVDVDCGALPDDLMEALLFGHKRGAFTGAVANARGLIVEAHNGTLFLDELGSLRERGQAKLLRVLETGEVRRVGEAQSRRVDFRVVATAQESIAGRIQSGAFREDLVQRVAGVVIRLPSLADRVEDIPLLAKSFAERKGAQITPDATAFLAEQRWPGNVRQLKWTVSRCALFAPGGRIDTAAVRAAMESGPRSFGSSVVDASEESVAELKAMCRHHRGDADRIAESMGIGRSTLYRRLKDAGLSLRTFKRRAGMAGG